MKIKLIKLIDTIIGKALCLVLGYLDYLFNWTLKDASISTPGKILFIRPGGMGDFLYLLPALALVKKYFPQTTIHVLAEKRNMSVKDLSNAIHKIIPYDINPFGAIAALRREKYDMVIDTEQFHNSSAIFAYITRAKVRIGFKAIPSRNHLYTHLIHYSLKGHEAGEFLRLLEPLGIKSEKIELHESVSAKKIKDTPLFPEFLDLKRKYDSIILLAPRGGDKYRHWAPQKYSKVIKHLLKSPKQAVVLVGGKSEKKIARQIVKNNPSAGDQLISLVGKTSLLELSRIITESNLFIGSDSGIAILAVMLGVKSVTLFGSTDEKKWAVENPYHRVVRKNLPCSPCYILGNHKLCRNIDCMERISAEEVISVIETLRH